MQHLIDAAQVQLQNVVKDWYSGLSVALGIIYTATPDAPEDLAGMSEAFKLSMADNRRYPVLSLHAEDTIYESRDVNYMFRFIHDIEHHVFRRLTTSVEHEVEAGRLFAQEARQRAKRGLPGQGEKGLELLEALAYADTAGQTFYFAAHGRFPERQAAFSRFMAERLIYVPAQMLYGGQNDILRRTIDQVGPIF